MVDRDNYSLHGISNVARKLIANVDNPYSAGKIGEARGSRYSQKHTNLMK